MIEVDIKGAFFCICGWSANRILGRTRIGRGWEASPLRWSRGLAAGRPVWTV